MKLVLLSLLVLTTALLGWGTYGWKPRVLVAAAYSALLSLVVATAMAVMP